MLNQSLTQHFCRAHGKKVGGQGGMEQGEGQELQGGWGGVRHSYSRMAGWMEIVWTDPG